MNNHTFTPGDRVRAYPSGRIGTIVDVDDSTAANYPGFTHLQYDGDDGVSLCDTQKLLPLDRAVELESFSAAEIKAELELRELQPPAGFRTETFMMCGADGYDPCEPYGECEHEKDITFRCRYYEATDWRASTQWTPERGIFYILQHDGLDVWTQNEIDGLTEALGTIRREIGQAAALDHLRRNPELVTRKMTMDAIFKNATEIGVLVSDLIGAWTILNDSDKAAGK